MTHDNRMNLHDQLGALESSLDELLHAAAASQPASASEAALQPASLAASGSANPQAESGAAEPAPSDSPEQTPTLTVSRPARDAIEMTIAGKSVLLNPQGVSELIEELSNARASMSVEQPGGLPSGWRFASTKNPMMATQKYSNGDRLLVLRHTGHGWVPFTFSPDAIIEMYAMLTRR
jgi:hypothetical protein